MIFLFVALFMIPGYDMIRFMALSICIGYMYKWCWDDRIDVLVHRNLHQLSHVTYPCLHPRKHITMMKRTMILRSQTP